MAESSVHKNALNIYNNMELSLSSRYPSINIRKKRSLRNLTSVNGKLAPFMFTNVWTHFVHIAAYQNTFHQHLKCRVLPSF